MIQRIGFRNRVKLSLICRTLSSIWIIFWLVGCNDSVLNSPYSESDQDKSILYTSFSERPKHLDPAKSYSANEYSLITQIYEPPFQYHYLKRPYTLQPLTAVTLPEIKYFNKEGRQLSDTGRIENIAYTDYVIEIKKNVSFQPHAAFALSDTGEYLYHHLTENQLGDVKTLSDFNQTGTRELTAEDYVYQIKRLANPKIQSPIAELMKQRIVGMDDFAERMLNEEDISLREAKLAGLKVLDRYRYRIRIKNKYSQFIYWLAMPFFAPMPWEADAFYSQPGLIRKNISLDWFPVGTGPYMLTENNPNRRMTMQKNPHFHAEFYPTEGDLEDLEAGLLSDAGKKLPFMQQVVFMLEKETIPYWNKFLQGYYDKSGIDSDSFNQAIQFSGGNLAELTPSMQEKGIQLQTAVTTSIFYMGFNMLDPVIGGYDQRSRKLRQAIAIAVDYEEFISIFMNGRGVPAQGMIPPGIFGFAEGEEGFNPYVYDWDQGEAKRKAIDVAKKLIADAGYPHGRDPKTGKSLILYFDTAASGPDNRAQLNWYRKQLKKLGIQLVIRATDYNRFQQKMHSGNAQIFTWGWNADYPDPENFFFLLYGGNAKVKNGGENAVNYQNHDFDRLFEQMRDMETGPERFKLIQQLQELVRYDAPWAFGFHPKSFSLFQPWYGNVKPNLMANNTLKYTKIDPQLRYQLRQQWNKPSLWPLIMGVMVLLLMLFPAIQAYRRRLKETSL